MSSNNDQITVCTAVVNNPLFIELQYHTLKKYMKCPYEFIVFNDAKDFPDYSNGFDPIIKNDIINTCESLNIKCINIPNEDHKIVHEASIRTADSCNYMLRYQLQNPGKYLVLDSDMFLIREFNGREYYNFDCAVVSQKRQEEYFWNGIYYFDTRKMKDTHLLNWDCTPGYDTGGAMQYWLKNQDKSKIYFYDHYNSGGWSEIPDSLSDKTKLIEFIKTDPRNNENGSFYTELYDNNFFHFRAGGNWAFKRNPVQGLQLNYILTQKLKDALVE
jgi:hypothetical protein